MPPVRQELTRSEASALSLPRSDFDAGQARPGRAPGLTADERGAELFNDVGFKGAWIDATLRASRAFTVGPPPEAWRLPRVIVGETRRTCHAKNR